jgi:hypothetical protein
MRRRDHPIPLDALEGRRFASLNRSEWATLLLARGAGATPPPRRRRLRAVLEWLVLSFHWWVRLPGDRFYLFDSDVYLELTKVGRDTRCIVTSGRAVERAHGNLDLAFARAWFLTGDIHIDCISRSAPHPRLRRPAR